MARTTVVVALVVVVVVVVVAMVTTVSMAVPRSASACWSPPVDAPVVDPFREPACPWCPGNRGLEYGTGAGAVVRAVAAGRVSFSGEVADVGYVVVRHADGRRTTYGGLVGIQLGEGDPVVARARVGVTDRNLHFGLRDGERYLDPAPFLGHVVHRARLVPADGSAARPAPPPRLRCDVGPTRSRVRYTHPPAPSVRTGPLNPSRPHPPLLRSPVGAWGRVQQPHEENHHGRHHHAPDARGRGALRAPDPPLEPEDEALHLR